MIFSPVKEKKCRRKRHDCFNRDYICGCGKGYLSYPALYTHLKTKHNGVPPQGTVSPALYDDHKINEKHQKIAELYSDQNYQTQSERKPKYEEKDSILELWALLFLIQNKLRKNGLQVKYIDTILNSKIHPYNNFPTHLFKFQEDILPILAQIKLLQDSQDKNQQYQIYPQQYKTVNFVYVFALYLFNACRSLTQQSYNELAILIVSLLNTYQQFGVLYVQQFQQTVADMNMFPYIAESFIDTHVKYYLTNKIYIEDQHIMGVEPDQLSYQVYILINFCSWLNECNFSEYCLFFSMELENN